MGRLRDIFSASWGVLGASLGRLGGILGASWDVLRQNRLGAVWEPSWKRLGGVLGMSWAVLEASCGRLVGLFEVSLAVFCGFWSVWGHLGGMHLVRDFHTKKWLHVSLASEMPFFDRFL